jgi:hypothetical protein
MDQGVLMLPELPVIQLIYKSQDLHTWWDPKLLIPEELYLVVGH